MVPVFDLIRRPMILCTLFGVGGWPIFNLWEILMATEKATEQASTGAKDWLKKVDESKVGDLRKKYPKAFWIVGGVVLLSLIV